MHQFKVAVLSQMPNPQTVIYAAMHQDYSEGWVWDEHDRWPDETKCGEVVVKRLLMGERGHYGPLEHPQIVFNVGYFPHSVMQQARTHRVGTSFDVQCLAGDVEVTFVQASGSLRKLKIADLYDLWANGERAVRDRKIGGRQGEPAGYYRRDCKTRLTKMGLRVFNEQTKCFEIGRIKEVLYSGVQPVYRLKLEDGKTLDCTTNHRLLTAHGWQRMGDALGLITNAEHQVMAMTRSCELMCNGRVRYDALYTQKSWLTAQVEQGLNAREIAECCNVSHHLEEKFAQEFHPIDGTSGWNIKPRSPGYKLTAHPVAIVGVEYLGLQPTYDLEVAGDWHNFVANGVVVHNSMRYTGQRIVKAALGGIPIEDVFYLRPVGEYVDRFGKKYTYTEAQRQADLEWCQAAAERYKNNLEAGMAEEHARGILPFDYRQHFVVSFNVRSLMHFLDLRAKKDAQLEIQSLCDLLWPHFQAWVPEIADWYEKNRLGKARLSP